MNKISYSASISPSQWRKVYTQYYKLPHYDLIALIPPIFLVKEAIEIEWQIRFGNFKILEDENKLGNYEFIFSSLEGLLKFQMECLCIN